VSLPSRPAPEAAFPMSSDAERRAAFDSLVTRYQDMAYACALSQLRDRHLAEDAAQEALLTAWLNLDQLREPAAFPSWLRRIVLSRCSRIRRSRSGAEVTLDGLIEAAPTVQEPENALLRAADSEAVRHLLASLPEGERAAVTLYYIHDYSLSEIAACLGITVAATKQRLYSARRRLKGPAFEMFGEQMRRARPSGDDRFSERLRARLRPLSDSDWDQIARLAEAVDPGGPEEVQWWIRHRKSFEESGLTQRHFVVGDGSLVLGYGVVEQAFAENEYRLYLVAPESDLVAGTGETLWARLLHELEMLGARRVWAMEYGTDPVMVQFLLDRGFRERLRYWELRRTIPPSPMDERVALPAGVRIAHLAEARQRDPEVVNRLIAFWDVCERAWNPTDPSRAAQNVVRRVQNADVDPERYFLALEGSEIRGIGNLRPPCTELPDRSQLVLVVPPGTEPGAVAVALRVRADAAARERGDVMLLAMCRADVPELREVFRYAGFEDKFEYVELERPVCESPPE
jgi:RNA polymerase sigma factor (sigma-70 family)